MSNDRARFEHVQGAVKALPLGVASVCWMVALSVITATQAYEAFHYGFGLNGDEIWLKLAVLAQTANYALAGAALLGIGLAVLSGTQEAKLSYLLGGLIGGWIALVSLAGVAAAMHGYGEMNPFTANRGSQGIAAFVNGGLGLIVAMIALGLLVATDEQDSTQPPTNYGGPEIAELS